MGKARISYACVNWIFARGIKSSGWLRSRWYLIRMAYHTKRWHHENFEYTTRSARLDATTLDSVDWTNHCVIQQGSACFHRLQHKTRLYTQILYHIYATYWCFCKLHCPDMWHSYCRHLRCMGNIHPNPTLIEIPHATWSNRHRASKLRYVIFHKCSKMNTQIYCTKEPWYQTNTVSYGVK